MTRDHDRPMRIPTLPLLVVLAAGSLLPAPARADDDTPWIGKTILVKKYDIRIIPAEKGVKPVTLKAISYKVIADNAGYLWVREDGVDGKFDKRDAVLLEDAVDYFTGRIKANAKDTQAYNLRAWAWTLQEEFDHATKDYNEIIRLDPKNFAAFAARGNVKNSLKEYDKAIKDFDEAIRLQPKERYTYVSRGNAWRCKKEYDKAIKDYDAAIRLDPRFGYAYGNRAIARFEIKEYEKAVKDYEESLRLIPMESWVHRDFAWFLATCPEAKYRDGKRAVALARKAIELANNGAKTGSFVATLAAALAEDGDFEGAVKSQETALEDAKYVKEVGDSAKERLKLYRDKKPFRYE